MSQLHLPDEVEAGYRLVVTDAFGCSFSINVYGAGRKGWLVASLRDGRGPRDIGPRRLLRGQWRTLLNFVKQCRFWELPERLPEPTDVTVEDGEWLTLSGREGDRFHRIERFVWREPGLEQLRTYLERISKLFPLPPEPQKPHVFAPESEGPAMFATTEELLNTVLALPEADRLEFVEALIVSLQPTDKPPFDESWREVIQRRSAEMDSGAVTPIPWEEVKRRARAEFGD